MKLEYLPVILGGLMVLIGLALLADAFMPEGAGRIAERRRRARPERHRFGEAMLGGGIIATGAALIGRDTWRFTNLTLIIAMILFLLGLVLNYKYLRGRFFGPGHTGTRRATDGEVEEPPKYRVR
ncbi:MAG: hypothetical protein M3081_09445 [Gemmatimonadota bacterium]|nr:hypothetical protein [Gemmatimonadota bacterium]